MQHSRALTKKSASNLALAFVLLPKPKRDAMAALYAFCREVDDVADEDSLPTATRREQLAAWRKDIRLACDNKNPQFPSEDPPADRSIVHRLGRQRTIIR